MSLVQHFLFQVRNFSIRTSYSHFRESSFPTLLKRCYRCCRVREGKKAQLFSLIIKGASGRVLFTLSALSITKFPKVRRRAQRHSASAFVRLRSAEHHPIPRRKRHHKVLHRESDPDFSRILQGEEKREKESKDSHEIIRLTVHRCTDDKSSNGVRPGIFVGSGGEREREILSRRREKGNLQDLPPGARAVPTYEITCNARGIFLRRPV